MLLANSFKGNFKHTDISILKAIWGDLAYLLYVLTCFLMTPTTPPLKINTKKCFDGLFCVAVDMTKHCGLFHLLRTQQVE